MEAMEEVGVRVGSEAVLILGQLQKYGLINTEIIATKELTIIQTPGDTAGRPEGMEETGGMGTGEGMGPMQITRFR